MPIASSSTTSRRLLALLSLLQSRRDWPAPVLSQRLKVSERTIRRDIDRLRELDYTIEATRGPDGGYRLRAGAQLPPLMFDDEQAVAIALALRTAGTIGAGIEDAAERALATITQLLPSRLAHRIDDLVVDAARRPHDTHAVVAPATLARIGEAIRTRHELRFDYAVSNPPADSELPPVRRTDPHHLLLRGGRWYLIGFSPDRDRWRVYRVDRITPRNHNGGPFTPRSVPGGDPAGYLSARFKGSGDGTDTWPHWGTAILHAPVSAIEPYLDDGAVEPLTGDRCRVRLGSWSWGSLASAFTRFEADISDVEPPELRQAFTGLSERTRIS